MANSLENQLTLPKEIDIMEIVKLNSWKHSLIFDILSRMAEKGEEISDDWYSYLINPPPIYAAKKDEVMERIVNEHAERYITNRKPAARIVALVKQEFYDFVCTGKAYYKKQRNLIKGGATGIIAGISAIIATKLSNIEIGTITALVSAFVIVLSKIGMKVFCEVIKPRLVAKETKTRKSSTKKHK